MLFVAINEFFSVEYLPEDGKEWPKHVAGLGCICHSICIAVDIYIYIVNVSYFFPPDTIITSVMKYIADRDSSVGIATRYGLHGPGIETHLARD